jgi:hypothetical protein
MGHRPVIVLIGQQAAGIRTLGHAVAMLEHESAARRLIPWAGSEEVSQALQAAVPGTRMSGSGGPPATP